MKKLICATAAMCLFAAPAFAATKILFMGNNITFASNSMALNYQPETIHDLNTPLAGNGMNGRPMAGVPAIFKQFAVEAGLDYDVYIEAVPNTQFDYHIAKERDKIDQPWDIVVANTYTTLSQQHPGDPSELIAAAKQLGDIFYAKNPDVKFYIFSTWTRADLTLGSKEDALKHEMQTDRNIDHDSAAPWFGKSVQQMGKDMEAGAEAAVKPGSHVTGVVPMALAFNRAIDTGVADGNPYDDMGASKIMLWASDKYHGSIFAAYLSGLMDFGKITGLDPQSLFKNGREKVSQDFFLAPEQAEALAKVAHDTLAAQGMVFKTAMK